MATLVKRPVLQRSGRPDHAVFRACQSHPLHDNLHPQAVPGQGRPRRGHMDISLSVDPVGCAGENAAAQGQIVEVGDPAAEGRSYDGCEGLRKRIGRAGPRRTDPKSARSSETIGSETRTRLVIYPVGSGFGPALWWAGRLNAPPVGVGLCGSAHFSQRRRRPVAGHDQADDGALDDGHGWPEPDAAGRHRAAPGRARREQQPAASPPVPGSTARDAGRPDPHSRSGSGPRRGHRRGSRTPSPAGRPVP